MIKQEDEDGMVMEVHDACKKLADENNMTLNEYLYAIHGGGFPCDCKDITPALKGVETYDSEHYCIKCGNYYKPAMTDPRFRKKELKRVA